MDNKDDIQHTSTWVFAGQHSVNLKEQISQKKYLFRAIRLVGKIIYFEQSDGSKIIYLFRVIWLVEKMHLFQVIWLVEKNNLFTAVWFIKIYIFLEGSDYSKYIYFVLTLNKY